MPNVSVCIAVEIPSTLPFYQLLPKTFRVCGFGLEIFVSVLSKELQSNTIKPPGSKVSTSETKKDLHATVKVLFLEIY